jgi:hypothetical protein
MPAEPSVDPPPQELLGESRQARAGSAPCVTHTGYASGDLTWSTPRTVGTG